MAAVNTIVTRVTVHCLSASHIMYRIFDVVKSRVGRNTISHSSHGPRLVLVVNRIIITESSDGIKAVKLEMIFHSIHEVTC